MDTDSLKIKVNVVFVQIAYVACYGIMFTHWTTLYHQTELPLDDLFDDPEFLLRYNQDAVTLYISGCPQLHLFDIIIINVTPEDCTEMCHALWRALYKDDWDNDREYVVRCGSSVLKIKQIYKYSGMTSLNIIRHNVPEPDF